MSLSPTTNQGKKRRTSGHVSPNQARIKSPLPRLKEKRAGVLLLDPEATPTKESTNHTQSIFLKSLRSPASNLASQPSPTAAARPSQKDHGNKSPKTSTRLSFSNEPPVMRGSYEGPLPYQLTRVLIMSSPRRRYAVSQVYFMICHLFTKSSPRLLLDFTLIMNGANLSLEQKHTLMALFNDAHADLEDDPPPKVTRNPTPRHPRARSSTSKASGSAVATKPKSPVPLLPVRAGTPATPKTPTTLVDLVTATSPSASTLSLVDISMEQSAQSPKVTQLSSPGPDTPQPTEPNPIAEAPTTSKDDISPMPLSGETNNTRARSPFKFITSPFSSSSKTPERSKNGSAVLTSAFSPDTPQTTFSQSTSGGKHKAYLRFLKATGLDLPWKPVSFDFSLGFQAESTSSQGDDVFGHRMAQSLPSKAAAKDFAKSPIQGGKSSEQESNTITEKPLPLLPDKVTTEGLAKRKSFNGRLSSRALAPMVMRSQFLTLPSQNGAKKDRFQAGFSFKYPPFPPKSSPMAPLLAAPSQSSDAGDSGLSEDLHSLGSVTTPTSQAQDVSYIPHNAEDGWGSAALPSSFLSMSQSTRSQEDDILSSSFSSQKSGFHRLTSSSSFSTTQKGGEEAALPESVADSGSTLLSSPSSGHKRKHTGGESSSSLKALVAPSTPQTRPSSKRIRFTPHEKHWEPDGNVLIELQGIRFKLQKSRLAKKSLWFREKFCENPGDLDENENARVYRIDDVEVSLSDFEALMDAVENSITFMYDKPSFEVISAILRAATALCFPDFATWARRSLEDTWPSSIESLSTTYPSTFAIETVVLARNRQVPAVLKRVMYELVRTQDFLKEFRRRGEDAMGKSNSLSLSEFTAIVEVRELFSSLWTSFALSPMDPSQYCQPSASTAPSSSRCAANNPTSHLVAHAKLVHVSGILEAYQLDPISGLQALIDAPWKEEGVCAECVSSWKDTWGKARLEIWTELEGLFGLVEAPEVGEDGPI